MEGLTAVGKSTVKAASVDDPNEIAGMTETEYTQFLLTYNDSATSSILPKMVCNIRFSL